MIFKPELAKLVLRGLKTETRRPVKHGEHDCRYRLQHSYAVQRTPTDQDRRAGYRGRAKTIDGARIIVTGVDRQNLAQIDRDAAVREGFANEIQFAHYWMRLYEPGWPEQVEDYCPRCQGHAEIDGEPCPNQCDVGTVLVDKPYEPVEIWERFIARHGDTIVWAITFELEQDELRLLTPATRPHGSELGYTTEPWNAMSDEPEAIDLARLSKDWRTRSQLHQRAARDSAHGVRLAGLRDSAERLAELQRMAAEANVDVGSDLKVIRHRLNAIERKVLDKRDERAA